ncbi:MAG: hypothetical protein IT287_06570 [Bdellovibrionaceae bacterium]|nr:hypothetical protein [Pseudobdellovibrionaceae bacterium]
MTVIAFLIDFARIGVYSRHVTKEGFSDGIAITVAATLSAFIGAYVVSKALQKVTMGTVQTLVSIGLLLLAIALGMGLTF